MWSMPGGGNMSTVKPGGREVISDTSGGRETSLTKSVEKGMMTVSVKSGGGEMSFTTAGSLERQLRKARWWSDNHSKSTSLLDLKSSVLA